MPPTDVSKGGAERDTGGWEPLFAYFLRTPAADPELERRARLSVAIALLLGLVLLLLAIVHALAGAWIEAGMNTGLALLIGSGPFAMRWTHRPRLVTHVVFALAFVGVIGLSVFGRGGGVTPATVALAELPLYAALLCGVRGGVWWAGASVVASIAIGLAAWAGFIADHMPREAMLLDEHVSLVVIICTMFAVAALYEGNTRRSLETIRRLDRLRQQAELDRIEAQAQVRIARAERLASMGRVAAATAHEINNPLSTVLLHLEHLEQTLRNDALTTGQREQLVSAIAAAHRIRVLIRDMQGLVRDDSTYPIPTAPTVDGSTVTSSRRLRIMIIDDETEVARALRLLMRRHDVCIVSSGEDALVMLDRDPAFDVVLCDVMMPELSGPDLYDAVRLRHPSLTERIVFMSGGTFTERTSRFRDESSNPFLDKPIIRAELESVLAQMAAIEH